MAEGQLGLDKAQAAQVCPCLADSRAALRQVRETRARPERHAKAVRLALGEPEQEQGCLVREHRLRVAGLLDAHPVVPRVLRPVGPRGNPLQPAGAHVVVEVRLHHLAFTP